MATAMAAITQYQARSSTLHRTSGGVKTEGHTHQGLLRFG